MSSRAGGDVLRGLTTRGRCFVAAGIAASALAIFAGQRDLLRVGVLVLVLPLICAWVVLRTRFRLTCTRALEPMRVPVGQATHAVLRLDNISRLPTGLLLIEDQVPYALGARPRFMLDRVEPRGHRAVSYSVRSDVRGRFTLGPLSIRLTDPFGMCELQRSFASRDQLTVTPVVHPLPSIPLGGDWSGSGDSRARSVAAAGEDDVATREYRYGDPLHRVHWRSTARYGELMVRREEQPWQSRATVLLDTRSIAHRGQGSASSFEWAVSAAASVSVHLLRHGYGVRLLTDTSASVSSASSDTDGDGGDFEGLLLDGLAVVAPSGVFDLSDVGSALRRGGGEGLLVAILGSMELDQAAELARIRHANTTAIAVLLNVSTWSHLTERHREEAELDYERSAALLTQSGWRVVRAGSHNSIPDIWPSAAARSPDEPIPVGAAPLLSEQR